MPDKTTKRIERLTTCGMRATDNPVQYTQELRQRATQLRNSEPIKANARFFKALGDETRLLIIKLLLQHEMCVCEVMTALNLTQPTASHHLRILEQADILSKRKDGQWVFYAISQHAATQELHTLKLL